jgi:hypothetical protein
MATPAPATGIARIATASARTLAVWAPLGYAGLITVFALLAADEGIDPPAIPDLNEGGSPFRRANAHADPASQAGHRRSSHRPYLGDGWATLSCACPCVSTAFGYAFRVDHTWQNPNRILAAHGPIVTVGR